jgi:phosphoglycerate dehydrogenase-like enzyme
VSAKPSPAHIAVEPDCWRRPALVAAVEQGGGTVVDPGEASALVWAEPAHPDHLPALLTPETDWVQLPYAGVESFLEMLDRDRVWTCGKGAYARPVAEHALTSILLLVRGFNHYSRASTWSAPLGRNLDDCRVTILGAGGITAELVSLLKPFTCPVTVVRRSRDPFPGVSRTVTLGDLDDVLAETDVIVLALALTAETIGILDAERLARLPPGAVVVNVARGRHVITDDLTAALKSGALAGAVLDVTDPEPLPDGHPLWSIDSCLVTPHVGNTPEMGLTLLSRRVAENVANRIAGRPLVGAVDIDLGY